MNERRFRKPFVRRGIVAAIGLMLSGCGGEGGAEETGAITPAPAPTPTPGPAPSPAPTPARWTPKVGDSFQWQLTGTVNTSYDVTAYDVDLIEVPESTIDQLHRQGKRVVCYFSGGSSEDFRADVGFFNPSDMGKQMIGWEGERWLDTRSSNVRKFMTDRRLDLAVSKGCDGVEPDNVDGYTHDTGFPLTPKDQLDYNRFLAFEAHRRNLMIGLKNDLDQIGQLVGDFDFAINEQCHEYSECDKLRPFTDAGKPAFNVEYKAEYRDNIGGARTQLCAESRTNRIYTLVMPLELNDAFRYSCD